jgi:hypothetical protein
MGDRFGEIKRYGYETVLVYLKVLSLIPPGWAKKKTRREPLIGIVFARGEI